MTQLAQSTDLNATDLAANFFQQSTGIWRSERRYYTLPEGKTQEMVSRLTVRFLIQGCAELVKLAEKHNMEDLRALRCGSEVTWESHDSISGHRQSRGSTVFGVLGQSLYRDRGFATPKPVIAEYYLSDPNTLCLRTEYNDSVFEEEIKHIGQKYRTRQSIISRAGEQQMIGQYLEKRLD
ncbi:MAG: phycobiliprotein lyase [Oscillatoriales cyanobacterium RM2_1_1]|nr:phycobiliprotein lyase [Oscillatoriales cyanobacterium SM2_3_0]NJO44175.1 phycobiliprotein lyase [Oscillatoriales cyanobacterium RM2_1_1]